MPAFYTINLEAGASLLASPGPSRLSVAQDQGEIDPLVQEQPHFPAVGPVPGADVKAVVEDSDRVIPIRGEVVAVAKAGEAHLLPARATSCALDFHTSDVIADYEVKVLIENLQRTHPTGIGVTKSVVHNFLPATSVADLVTPDLSASASAVVNAGVEVPFEGGQSGYNKIARITKTIGVNLNPRTAITCVAPPDLTTCIYVGRTGMYRHRDNWLF